MGQFVGQQAQRGRRIIGVARPKGHCISAGQPIGLLGRRRLGRLSPSVESHLARVEADQRGEKAARRIANTVRASLGWGGELFSRLSGGLLSGLRRLRRLL